MSTNWGKTEIIKNPALKRDTIWDKHKIIKLNYGKKGYAQVSGIACGKIYIIYENINKVMFRVSGYTWRSGLGEQSYASPQYIIATVENGLLNNSFEVEYTRESMSKAKKLAKDYYDSL